MRIFFIIFLFSITVKANPFVFEIINNALSPNIINLGTVDSKLCASPGLILMSNLSDGINNGTCIGEKTPIYSKINILIPLKIQLTSTENYDITFSKVISINDFNNVSLRNIRNQSLGGGQELLNSTIQMNNQTINAELELTAEVSGSDVKDNYSSTIEISIAPSI